MSNPKLKKEIFDHISNNVKKNLIEDTDQDLTIAVRRIWIESSYVRTAIVKYIDSLYDKALKESESKEFQEKPNLAERYIGNASYRKALSEIKSLLGD